MQMLCGPPYAAWDLLVDGAAAQQRSLLACMFATLGVLWICVGALGLYAVTAKRVQSLVVFTSLEVFAAVLTAGGMSILLLLNHLECWDTGDTSVQDAVRAPWLRCPNILGVFGATMAMVVWLGGTASVALSLRLRIQKTGKRNLDWNQKFQRKRERNVRRGGSHALRTLTNGKDSPGDEDTRIKYLATHDSKYITRSLLLRFATVEHDEAVRLLLNLRKGYFKHGDFFGTKIYLSQVGGGPRLSLERAQRHAAARRRRRPLTPAAACDRRRRRRPDASRERDPPRRGADCF